VGRGVFNLAFFTCIYRIPTFTIIATTKLQENIPERSCYVDFSSIFPGFFVHPNVDHQLELCGAVAGGGAAGEEAVAGGESGNAEADGVAAVVFLPINFANNPLSAL